MHGGNESCGPLPSIFCPDTDEAPIFVFGILLRAKVQDHEAPGEPLGNRIYLTPGLPDVLSEAWLSVSAVLQLLARAQERTVRQLLDVPFEHLQESVYLRLAVRLLVQTIIVSWQN